MSNIGSQDDRWLLTVSIALVKVSREDHEYALRVPPMRQHDGKFLDIVEVANPGVHEDRTPDRGTRRTGVPPCRSQR